jgi:hypothetical protein
MRTRLPPDLPRRLGEWTKAAGATAACPGRLEAKPAVAQSVTVMDPAVTSRTLTAPIHRILGSFWPHVLLISSDPIAGRASMSHNEVIAAFLVGGSIAWFLGLAIRGWFNAHYEIRKRK